MGLICSTCSNCVDDINVNCGGATISCIEDGLEKLESKVVGIVTFCYNDVTEHGCRQTGRRIKNRTVRCCQGVAAGATDCFGSIGNCCDDTFCKCCSGTCAACDDCCNDFGNEVCYVWDDPLRTCYGDRKEITFALGHYVRSGENYPEDFKKLAKAKKLILTAEQEAVEENKRLDAEDEAARASGKEVKRRLSTGGGMEDGVSFDTLPQDFIASVNDYVNEIGALAECGFDGSIESAVAFAAPMDLIGVAKAAGELLAPFVPAPSNVGKKAASRSIVKQGREFHAKSKDLEKGIKPEENLTFKALEGAMLSRYQTGLVLERRPSCTAKPCLTKACPNLTLHVSGVCTACIKYDELHQNYFKPYNPDPTNEESKEQDPKTLQHFREQVKLNEESRSSDPKKKETKQERAMREFVRICDLRREMDELASQPFEVMDLEGKIKAASELVNYSIRYAVDPKELGLLYDQFQLFDVDGDNIINLEDFKSVVSYISPELREDPNLLTSLCLQWFGPDTFYPNYKGNLQSLDIAVDFQTYVEAVLTFRIETEKHKLVDNLNFPFWSLRDCIVYSRPSQLDGYAYKRGSGNVARWQKRHFRIVDDEGLDFDPKTAGFFAPRPTGSKACLVYDLDEEKSQGEVKQSRRIDLRDLYLVQFSPKTSLPHGKDVPENLVCFKLTFGDQTRVTLACEEKQAMEWTSIFHRFAVGGKLITDWRLQYAGLSKNKTTLRDWVNAGYVIYRMQSYLDMQRNFRSQIDGVVAMETDNESPTTQAFLEAAKKMAICTLIRKLSRGAPKLYCSPKERLILRVCNISEDALEKSMVGVQVGIKLWDASKDTLKTLDDTYLYSGVRTGVFIGKNFYAGFQYYKAAKVAYCQKRYGTSTWQPAGEIRECAVCKTVFNSCSTKAEKKKHHCRSCGRIVCHACSTHKIFFEITQKFKRVCDECLQTGSPPKAIDVFAEAAHEEGVKFKKVKQVVEEVDEDRWEDSDVDEKEFKKANAMDPEMFDQGDEGELSAQDMDMANAAKAASKNSKTSQ